jgi:hypothetical protein
MTKTGWYSALTVLATLPIAVGLLLATTWPTTVQAQEEEEQSATYEVEYLGGLPVRPYT